MTAAQLEDPEGRALVTAIHERKAATSDYTEHLISAAGGDGEPCRCWTEPARMHAGHCCMATAGQTCHETTGQAAHQEGTQ